MLLSLLLPLVEEKEEKKEEEEELLPLVEKELTRQSLSNWGNQEWWFGEERRQFDQ